MFQHVSSFDSHQPGKLFCLKKTTFFFHPCDRCCSSLFLFHFYANECHVVVVIAVAVVAFNGIAVVSVVVVVNGVAVVVAASDAAVALVVSDAAVAVVADVVFLWLFSKFLPL